MATIYSPMRVDSLVN